MSCKRQRKVNIPSIAMFFLILFLASALIFCARSPVKASDYDLPLMLDKATSYLKNAQNPDDSWGNRLAFRDTALAAEGLLRQGGDPAVIEAASTWLASNQAHNSTFTSLKAHLFSLIDDNSFSLTQEEQDLLSACQHLDGGVSLYPSGGANPLDTALAYPALLAGGDMEKGEKAIQYLIDSQCQDGGFSSFGLRACDLPATALALKALELRRLSETTFNLAESNAIAQSCATAAQRLASFQNQDGGFGKAGSTPYETALALEASSWIPEEMAGTDAALSWMYDHQLEGGSISGDLAATALLLAAARPNPSIDGIELSESEPPEGVPVVLHITLKNRGLSSTGPLDIHVFLAEDQGTPLKTIALLS